MPPIWLKHGVCPSNKRREPAGASFVKSEAVIEQLTFEFFESNPNLIILGPDPGRPGWWLARCPECHEIRSLSKASLSNLIFRKRSDCSACGRRKAGICKRTQLPTSESCIIIEQFHERRHGYTWTALVVCPDCGKRYPKYRAGIKDQGHTICKTCRLRRQAIPLPRSEKCIIIQEFVPGCSVANPVALVECPDCHKQFEKDRGSIVRNKHTICFLCFHSSPIHKTIHRGETHPLWQGGSDNHRGPSWDRTRKRIRERDNHTCQWPGCITTSATNGRLICVHHITPYKHTQDNSATNLICLCQTHHPYADHNLDESIPLLQSIVKEQLEPKYLEKTLVGQ